MPIICAKTLDKSTSIVLNNVMQIGRRLRNEKIHSHGIYSRAIEYGLQKP
jgi:hypothetical protein